MFCGNCGKEIDDKSKFCQFCGFKLILEDYNTNLVNTAQETINKIENSPNHSEQVTFVINEYKSKWITLLLYFFPFFGWLGIYNIYSNRKKGILQISLWTFIFFISIVIPMITEVDFIIGLMSFIVFILWISDIVWVFKLPKKYYIKNNIVMSK